MSVARKKVELTKQRANEMYMACAALERSNEPFSQRFAYAVAYNQDVIEGSVKAFESSAKKDADYNVYEEQRVELAKKHAHKGKDGEPIKRDGSYVIKESHTFETALKELQEEHPAYQARLDFLEEVTEFEFHVVKMRHVPPYLGIAHMRLFRCFIEFEEEEFECPACKAELCIKGDKLVDLYEAEPEPEPVPVPIEKAKAKKRKKKTR